ncbi:MAG: M20 family metallopeptidase [Bacillota bacterium]
MAANIEKYINRSKVEKLLTDLIKIPSPFFREDEVMEYTYNWLEERDFPVDYHKFHEDKVTDFEGTNVVGKLKSSEEGPTVLLNGHLDTVEVCEGWTEDPFGARIEDNKMYGLGALDMKSGVAAQLLALEAFKETVDSFNGEILYTFVCDEEGPFGLGTDALLLDGYTDDADVAVVTEPSAGFAGVEFPCLCLGARGGWKYMVKVKGKSAHGANPEKGINAISEASKILLEIEKSELKAHEKLGPGAICVIDFEGGGAPLSVPDSAEFAVFRHVTIGEDKSYIRNEVEKAIKRADIEGKAHLEFREAPHSKCDGFLPYVVSESNPYTRTFKESVKKGSGEKARIEYFSSVGDFNYLGARAKLPTYVFGPDGANYHSADEYVEIDTVVDTARVVYDFLLRVLVD